MWIHAGLGEGALGASGPARAAVTAGTSRARRQVDFGVRCGQRTDEEAQSFTRGLPVRRRDEETQKT